MRVSFFHEFWLLWLPSWSQESSTNRIWVDFIPHFKINMDLEYYGDAGYRIILAEDLHTFAVRPSVRYHLNPRLRFEEELASFTALIQTSATSLKSAPGEESGCIGLPLDTLGTNILQARRAIALDDRQLEF